MATQTAQDFYVVDLGNGKYRIFSVLPTGGPCRMAQRWVANGTVPVRAPDGELTAQEVNQFKTDLTVKHGCTVVNQPL
jgi:hypothetical protein